MIEQHALVQRLITKPDDNRPNGKGDWNAGFAGTLAEVILELRERLTTLEAAAAPPSIINLDSPKPRAHQATFDTMSIIQALKKTFPGSLQHANLDTVSFHYNRDTREAEITFLEN